MILPRIRPSGTDVPPRPSAAWLAAAKRSRVCHRRCETLPHAERSLQVGPGRTLRRDLANPAPASRQAILWPEPIPASVVQRGKCQWQMESQREEYRSSDRGPQHAGCNRGRISDDQSDAATADTSGDPAAADITSDRKSVVAAGPDSTVQDHSDAATFGSGGFPEPATA